MIINDNDFFGKINTSKIRALLFDVDGTLSDTDDQMVARIVSLMKPISWLFQDRNPEKFGRRFVMGLETPGNFFYNVADRLGIDGYLGRYYKWASTKKIGASSNRERFWIIPGVAEMLEALAKRYPLAIVSARGSSSTMEFLDFFELRSLFQVVVTSQTCQHTKPFPEPVIFAAQALGVPPKSCVMVGDTIVDIRSGKAAGAQTIGVLCGFGRAKELKRVGADMIIPSTKDLQNYLPD